jgi:hypothetical protein
MKQLKSTLLSLTLAHVEPAESGGKPMRQRCETGQAHTATETIFVKYDYRFSGVCLGGIQRKTRHVSASKIRSDEREK